MDWTGDEIGSTKIHQCCWLFSLQYSHMPSMDNTLKCNINNCPIFHIKTP